MKGLRKLGANSSSSSIGLFAFLVALSSLCPSLVEEKVAYLEVQKHKRVDPLMYERAAGI